MKRVRRIMALCLTLALLIGAAPLAFAADGGYTDVPDSHWAHDVIEKWSDYGILEGSGDGTFQPEREITLGEIAAMLSRLFGYSARTEAEVTPAWADVYVEQTIAAGVFEAADTIDASVVVTREQAVKYIALAFGIEPVDGATTFADDAEIGDEYKPYVNAFQQLGYIQGGGDNCFAPKAGYTRAAAAQVFENVTQDLGMPEQAVYALKAGAGASEIVFDQAMFPVEGFNGEVHLNPYARVLVLEQEIKVAVVALELVNVPSDVITSIKEIVSEKTGTPVGNIWVHATHAITTPHAPDDTEQRALYVSSVEAAVTEAAQQAAASFQPAVVGVGTGTCDVNANRDIQIGDSWYYGLNSTMPSNKEMTIISFAGLDGSMIGMLVSYGIKPTAIDNAEMDAGTRKISSDVPGVACRMLEEEFGAPALFCMPAAGDQIPKETAMYYIENEQGEAELVELSVAEGIEIVERLGAEMGNDAISIVKGITYTSDTQVITAADTSFTWPSKSGDGEVEIEIRGITIGDDIAFVGFKPEVNAVTEQELWEASPYQYTLLMSFIDGDQKYMPDDDSCDLQTWEYQRSGTAKGSAEQFVATAAELLEGIKSGEITGSTASGSETESGSVEAKQIIQMGGYNWIVLDEQDGKMLVLSEYVLEKRAYHAAGGAITWENCELRAYLNGEFYEKTFTEEEKERIVATTIENKSNPQYGIAGGNDTTDKIFLLSLGEAEKYLGDGIELLRATDITTGEAAWWHLRSPGEATDVAASVNAIGLIDYHGVFNGVTDPEGGVRPAMWVTVE